MVDYQFLGMVAVVVAVVTRGAVLPVLAITAAIALVTLAYEAGARHLRRRQAGPLSADSALPPDSELSRWAALVDRVLHSTD